MSADRIYSLCRDENWATLLRELPQATRDQVTYADPSYFQFTPLHYAIYYKAPLEVVKLLIDNGANANALAKFQETPLHLAAQHKAPLEVVKLLIDKGANVNAVETFNQQTPLHLAIGYNAPLEVVKLLIDKGANVNALTSDRRTPLILCAEYGGSAEVATLLLENGADPNVKDKQGKLASDYAREQNNQAVASVLSKGVAPKPVSKPAQLAVKSAPLTPQQPQKVQLLATASQATSGDAVSEALLLPSYVLFFSYAQKDTLAEVSLFYRQALQKYPAESIFHDANSKFKIGELTKHVQRSKNVIVMLSENYARRPFTMVELHYAIKSGANIVAVKVERPGADSFNFEKLKADIKDGRLSSYLSEDAWDLLREYDIGVEEVAKNLSRVIDEAAVEFSTKHPLSVQDAMINEVFKRLAA